MFFCRDCVKSWQSSKVMECEMCDLHLKAGWTPQRLLKVYGFKREAMDALGWSDVDLVPPNASREYLEQRDYETIELLNVPFIESLLWKRTNRILWARLGSLAGRLEEHLKPDNREQYKDFIKKELRALYLFNMVTTAQTKEMVWDALDPLLQHLIIANLENATSSYS